MEIKQIDIKENEPNYCNFDNEEVDSNGRKKKVSFCIYPSL